MPAKAQPKKAQSKTGPKKTSARKLQDFNHADAKRDAMAMFSSGLNSYTRGADDKWHKTVRKS